MPVSVLFNFKKKNTENLKNDYGQLAELYHYSYHRVNNIIIITVRV